jgi:predicted metal-dependent hydrolase
VVHELAHLLEQRHGEAFQALMDAYLPCWRMIREELNATPLAAERWA